MLYIHTFDHICMLLTGNMSGKIINLERAEFVIPTSRSSLGFFVKQHFIQNSIPKCFIVKKIEYE